MSNNNAGNNRNPRLTQNPYWNFQANGQQQQPSGAQRAVTPPPRADSATPEAPKSFCRYGCPRTGTQRQLNVHYRTCANVHASAQAAAGQGINRPSTAFVPGSHSGYSQIGRQTTNNPYYQTPQPQPPQQQQQQQQQPEYGRRRGNAYTAALEFQQQVTAYREQIKENTALRKWRQDGP